MPNNSNENNNIVKLSQCKFSDSFIKLIINKNLEDQKKKNNDDNNNNSTDKMIIETEFHKYHCNISIFFRVLNYFTKNPYNFDNELNMMKVPKKIKEILMADITLVAELQFNLNSDDYTWINDLYIEKSTESIKDIKGLIYNKSFIKNNNNNNNNKRKHKINNNEINKRKKISKSNLNSEIENKLIIDSNHSENIKELIQKLKDCLNGLHSKDELIKILIANEIKDRKTQYFIIKLISNNFTNNFIEHNSLGKKMELFLKKRDINIITLIEKTFNHINKLKSKSEIKWVTQWNVVNIKILSINQFKFYIKSNNFVSEFYYYLLYKSNNRNNNNNNNNNNNLYKSFKYLSEYSIFTRILIFDKKNTTMDYMKNIIKTAIGDKCFKEYLNENDEDEDDDNNDNNNYFFENIIFEDCVDFFIIVANEFDINLIFLSIVISFLINYKQKNKIIFNQKNNVEIDLLSMIIRLIIQTNEIIIKKLYNENNQKLLLKYDFILCKLMDMFISKNTNSINRLYLKRKKYDLISNGGFNTHKEISKLAFKKRKLEKCSNRLINLMKNNNLKNGENDFDKHLNLVIKRINSLIEILPSIYQLNELSSLKNFYKNLLSFENLLIISLIRFDSFSKYFKFEKIDIDSISDSMDYLYENYYKKKVLSNRNKNKNIVKFRDIEKRYSEDKCILIYNEEEKRYIYDEEIEKDIKLKKKEKIFNFYSQTLIIRISSYYYLGRLMEILSLKSRTRRSKNMLELKINLPFNLNYNQKKNEQDSSLKKLNKNLIDYTNESKKIDLNIIFQIINEISQLGEEGKYISRILVNAFQIKSHKAHINKKINNNNENNDKKIEKILEQIENEPNYYNNSNDNNNNNNNKNNNKIKDSLLKLDQQNILDLTKNNNYNFEYGHLYIFLNNLEKINKIIIQNEEITERNNSDFLNRNINNEFLGNCIKNVYLTCPILFKNDKINIMKYDEKFGYCYNILMPKNVSNILIKF